ncbi:hypothetical protein Glove_141g40 [Diversispora epigaea]|uniref:Uncharacterized protein n=1 Tax=Diversispora epigaea TaxID=1348612 RepID=A0A397J3D6_9GLOM|nr:hypothetical protein Glove_141g40 [Diversispora epigaea]
MVMVMIVVLEGDDDNESDNSLYLQLESADEIYELLSQEVSRLQELYACLN